MPKTVNESHSDNKPQCLEILKEFCRPLVNELNSIIQQWHNGKQNSKVKFTRIVILDRWSTEDHFSVLLHQLIINKCYQFRVPRNLRIDIKDRLEEYSQSIEIDIHDCTQTQKIHGHILMVIKG